MADEQNTLTVVRPTVIDMSPSASRSYDTPMVPVSPPDASAKAAETAQETPAAEPATEGAPASPEPAKPAETATEAQPDALADPKFEELPVPVKRVVTREKNRRQTAEAAVESLRQQNA